MPEVRFKGFSGEWEVSKLGEIVKITMGQSPKGENYTKNPHDNILVQGNADIKNGWVMPRLWTTQITKMANKGDIILSVRAPVGDVGKTHYDVVIGRGVAAIKGNEFIYQLLLKMKADDVWKKFSTGSTFESINSTDIKEVIIRVPNELEQTQIGNFFKQLDETIAIQQQELDTLKQTKQGFLQKMFPKEGESIPEIRFHKDKGNWKLRKLKDFGKSTSGTSLESEFLSQGDYKVISIGSYSTKSLYIDQGIRVNKTDKTTSRILKKGDLAMILNDKTSLGRIIGRVLLIEKDDLYVYNQRTQRIEVFSEEYSSKFLYYMLNADSIRQKIIKASQGNTQIYVNWSTISEFDYLVPNKKEQTQIGNFFKQLDKTIALCEQELDILKQTKKAFLQKMFV